MGQFCRNLKVSNMLMKKYYTHDNFFSLCSDGGSSPLGFNIRIIHSLKLYTSVIQIMNDQDVVHVTSHSIGTDQVPTTEVQDRF